MINQFDDASLAAAVRRSEELARLAPEDREHMPALGPQEFVELPQAFSQSTADFGHEKLAKGVAICLNEAIDTGLVAAGFTQTRADYSSISNSRGLFGFHRSTGAYVANTVRTRDGMGSGWASQSAKDVAEIDFGKVSATAVQKAMDSAGPRALEPGKYVTILEPACVANLIGMMMWSMNARSADEGRSFFSKKRGGNRLGETLFSEDTNIYSDPADDKVPGSPWGDDGVPQKKRHWIKGGVLSNLRYDRFWAQKSGVEPIPFPSNMIMTGGSGSVDDLVRSTRRGVLVTSLWYVRGLDPRTLLFTGLTRDGVFWIEDGRITHPVTNFRWNDSPIAVLKNVIGMSESVQIPPRPQKSTNVMVPGLKLKEFTFSSVSDAV